MKLSLMSAAVLLSAAVSLPAMQSGLEENYSSLKEALPSKDVAKIKQLAAETHRHAQEVITSAAPTNAEEKKDWQDHVTRAKEIDVFADYALFSTALQSEAAVAVDLFATLVEQSPKSKYLEDGYANYFGFLRATNAGAKVPAIAEAGLKANPDNVDCLTELMTAALGKGAQPTALAYAQRLIAAVAKHSKPEASAAAEWERRRGAALGYGYYVAGVVHSGQAKYFDAEKELRAALPYLRGNDAMLGPALFNLGVSCYQVGKMTLNKKMVLEGANFSKQASAIKGAHAAQAYTNASAMEREAATMR